jgi:hypothetical protein
MGVTFDPEHDLVLVYATHDVDDDVARVLSDAGA